MKRTLLLPALGVALIAASAFAAACGGDDDAGGETTTSTTATAATSGASPTATAGAGGSATGTAVATATGSATATATPEDGIPFELPGFTFKKDGASISGVVAVKEIRAARNATFDRVVFEFEGNRIPGYTVSYTQEVSACGSGEPVDAGGDAMVAIVLKPAQAHSEAGEPTVPREVPLEGMTVVRELRSFCDFEGVVSYVSGLSGARPYRVFELQNPSRLVIDFGH